MASETGAPLIPAFTEMCSLIECSGSLTTVSLICCIPATARRDVSASMQSTNEPGRLPTRPGTTMRRGRHERQRTILGPRTASEANPEVRS